VQGVETSILVATSSKLQGFNTTIDAESTADRMLKAPDVWVTSVASSNIPLHGQQEKL
jgi:hypothetical protein